MTAPGQHAHRKPVPRAGIATAFVILGVFAAGILIAVPAHQNYDQKEQAIAQNQDLADKVLVVCHQGGESAAPLVAIGACPLAQQVQATPLAQAPTYVKQSGGLNAQQVQDLIHAEIARQLPKTSLPPSSPEAVGGGARLGPFIPSSVAGQPGRGSYPGPVQDPPIPRTFFERAPERTFVTPPPPATRITVTRQAPPPPVTVTQTAMPPVTVTQPPPVTVTQPAPPPVTEEVSRPTPVQQGGLLPAVNTLLGGGL